MRGTGCAECGGTGYRGRIGVFEVLRRRRRELRQVLLKDATEASVAAQARASGMATLRTSAVEKARAGETTFEEVLRVTHTDHVSAETCPTCTRTVARDMVVCPWCTTALDRGRCSGCSRQLDPDWRICPWCRTPAA